MDLRPRPPKSTRDAIGRGIRLTAIVAIFAAIGAGLALVLIHADVVGRPHSQPTFTVAPSEDRVERLMERFDCSTTGLPAGEIPASALIRTTNGRVRVTSFDHGWAVHKGQRPGTLLAVCRKPVTR